MRNPRYKIVRALAVALAIACAIGVVFWLADTEFPEDRTSTVAGGERSEGDAESSQDLHGITQGGTERVRDDARDQSWRRELQQLDERQRREAELGAARAINDGNDPVPCQVRCDCPQGQECEVQSGLCLPSAFPVYCCDNAGCPTGEPCTTSDGRHARCETRTEAQ